MGMDKWMPNIVTALPGMGAMMSGMMKSKMKSKGVASVAELRDLCLEAEVKLIACQMTVDLFDMQPDEFIDGIDYAGAATFFEFAGESDVNLFT
jgi:peroxiredoxin family protein